MGNLYYDPQSWEKQKASDDINQYLIQNSEFQLQKIISFLLLQNKELKITEFSLGVLLQYVPQDKLDTFFELWNMYLKSKDDISKINWYIKKIFLSAKSFEAAKICVPEQYWKYLKNVTFTGDGDIHIRDEYCYSVLEQSTMNNLILGIKKII